ncbi:MAG: hypothetical protein M0036_04135 [Desulfobacteraceae bacterium]|nr:hypothetical protein [Desulfobacteraceae bacterium]
MVAPGTTPILIGSTFPLSLIRRPVLISPQNIDTFKGLLTSRPIVSFWGHQNTLSAARQLLGVDISPPTERPALELSDALLPMINNNQFTECWVVSPEYTPGYRPNIGEEVPMEQITGWQVLKIQWLAHQAEERR